MPTTHRFILAFCALSLSCVASVATATDTAEPAAVAADEPVKRFDLIARDGKFFQAGYLLRGKEQVIVEETPLRITESGEIVGTDNAFVLQKLFQHYARWKNPPQIVEKVLAHYHQNLTTNSIYPLEAPSATTETPRTPASEAPPGQELQDRLKKNLSTLAFAAACLSKIAEGETKAIANKQTTACSRTFESRYGLKKHEGVFVIEVPLGVSASTRKLILDNEPCLVETFAKRGLKLRLQNEPATFQSNSYSCTADLPTNHGNACVLALHELGHVLGLPDEYIDDCRSHAPARDTRSGFMAQAFLPLEQTHFPDIYVATILEPLCGR